MAENIILGCPVGEEIAVTQSAAVVLDATCEVAGTPSSIPASITVEAFCQTNDCSGAAEVDLADANNLASAGIGVLLIACIFVIVLRQFNL